MGTKTREMVDKVVPLQRMGKNSRSSQLRIDCIIEDEQGPQMASRKGRNIYILKYFMAARNCINILVLYWLEVRPSLPVRISAKYATAGN